tara:strand:- start:91 stop:687 length:597 start_codon:yes stop_codon:yes gene_type:complete
MSIILQSPEYLFPYKILTSQDSDFDSYKDDMIEWMRVYSLDNKTYERSNFGGYQSPDKFYLEESFAPYLNRITEQIVSTTEEYINDEQSEIPSGDLKLCNMWFNFNYENSYNVTHVHPGSVLAGVLWIQCPEGCNPITFEDPNTFARSLITKDCHENFTPEPGVMMIFPSYLPHRVDINRTNTTRISLSFNLDRTYGD